MKKIKLGDRVKVIIHGVEMEVTIVEIGGLYTEIMRDDGYKARVILEEVLI